MNNTNSLELITNVITMSSIEIATLTGKAHKNVIRDIDLMVEKFNEMSENLPVSNSSWVCKPSTYLDPNNQARPCYLLSKQATLDLVSGYSFEIRYYINRRWEELESQKQAGLPKTLSESLFLAAKLALEKEQLALENAQKDLVIEEQAEFINDHVHFPKYIRAEDYEDGNYMSRLDIRKEYFPELGTTDRLTLVLSYYGCEKALYKNFKGMITEVFKTNDIQDIRSKFEDDLEFISLSKSRQSNICRHPALPNMELRIKI